MIEPAVLPQTPHDAYTAGSQADVPLLLGSNAEEGRSFVATRPVTAATFEADIAQQVGQLPPTILAAYPYKTDAEATQRRIELETDLRFGWDMWAWARLQARPDRSPVFYYRFHQRPPFPAGSIYADWGAGHFTELWYMFGHQAQQPWPWTASDRALARTMLGHWSAFVRTGNPNAHGLAHWPRYDVSRGAATVRHLGLAHGVVVSDQSTGLQAIDDTYSALRQLPLPGR